MLPRPQGPGVFSYSVSIADASQTYYAVTGLANAAAFDHVTATFTTPAALVGTPTIALQNLGSDYQHAVDFANVYLAVAVVPEPATAALAALGIVLAAGRWSRRRSA